MKTKLISLILIVSLASFFAVSCKNNNTNPSNDNNNNQPEGIEKYAGTWLFTGTVTIPSEPTPIDTTFTYVINADGSITMKGNSSDTTIPDTTIPADSIKAGENNTYTITYEFPNIQPTPENGNVTYAKQEITIKFTSDTEGTLDGTLTIKTTEVPDVMNITITGTLKKQ